MNWEQALTYLPWVIAISAGLAAALAGFLVSRLAAQVPDEDRTYRDDPPVGFRLIWWPVQWTSFYMGRCMPAAAKRRAQQRLRAAGIDYALSPEQFFSAQLLFSMLAGLFAWHVVRTFGLDAYALALICAAALIGFAMPAIWLTDKANAARRDSLKALPFYLDLITLCVEAGLNLTGALQQAVSKGPPSPLRDEIGRVLRDIRAGRSRAEALRTFSSRMNEPAISNLVTTLIQADNTGMNLGPMLRAQADQRRMERFARAETLAMKAPVKLLFPLIAFIFPCVFIVLGFPIAMKFMAMGL